MRVLAHFCQDQKLLALFTEDATRKSGDIYRLVSSQLLNKPLDAGIVYIF
jgi:hypothetical protein